MPEDRAGCARALEALSDAPALGTLAVEVPGNGRRQARASASLGPGDGHHDRGDQARRTAGTEAINGVLPIKGFASASEKVAWYGKRWGIALAAHRHARRNRPAITK